MCPKVNCFSVENHYNIQDRLKSSRVKSASQVKQWRFQSSKQGQAVWIRRHSGKLAKSALSRADTSQTYGAEQVQGAQCSLKFGGQMRKRRSDSSVLCWNKLPTTCVCVCVVWLSQMNFSVAQVQLLYICRSISWERLGAARPDAACCS